MDVPREGLTPIIGDFDGRLGQSFFRSGLGGIFHGSLQQITFFILFLEVAAHLARP